jgi:hypothetical protein
LTASKRLSVLGFGIGVALLAVLLGNWLAVLIVVATAAAVLAGYLRPALLIPLMISAVVVTPPYVGWVVPGGQFFNLVRGVVYGGIAGVALRLAAQREEPTPARRPTDKATAVIMVLLVTAWIMLPAIALTHGFANGIRGLNAAAYQAFPFWIGWRYASGLKVHRLLQLSLAFLLWYTLPFWAYELTTGTSVFSSYTPPIPGLMDARDLLLRDGHVRVEATFGHPLAFDQFLLLAVPIVGSAILVRAFRWFGSASLGVAAVALVLTGSRSPWLALVGALIAMIFARRPWVSAGIAVGIVVLVLITPLSDAVGPAAIMERIQAGAASTLAGYSTETETTFSTASRIFLIINSLRAIAQQPLAGFGVNATLTGAGIPTVDTYYLALPVEVGVPTACVLFCGIATAWIAIARRRLGAEYTLAAVAVGAFFLELFFVGLHDTFPAAFTILGALLGARGTLIKPVAETAEQSHANNVDTR